MAYRVLVTRPEPGATRSAKKLGAMGFEPILLPLTEIRPLPVAADEPFRQGMVLPPPLTPPHEGEGYSETLTPPSPSWGGVRGGRAAVAVTSANAIRHAPKELIAALAHLPCYAVGEKTARAAREAGFSSVEEGPGTAEALADGLAEIFAGKTIVYLCGRVRLAGFERRLEAAGIHVFPVETYDTVLLPHQSEVVAARCGGRTVDAVLLYSAKAAEAMAALAARPELAALFRNATFLCLSKRVAGALASIAEERIRVSPEPNEKALCGLLPS